MMHDDWIKKASELALNSLPDDVPVGALILNPAGECIAQGWNTREKDKDPAGHAEMMALKEAGKQFKDWRLIGCTLYVTLEPCPMCASAILQARVSNVVFGAWDPVQGALGSATNLTQLYPNAIKVIGGIQEKACQTQLQTFFKSRRPRPGPRPDGA